VQLGVVDSLSCPECPAAGKLVLPAPPHNNRLLGNRTAPKKGMRTMSTRTLSTRVCNAGGFVPATLSIPERV